MSRFEPGLWRRRHEKNGLFAITSRDKKLDVIGQLMRLLALDSRNIDVGNPVCFQPGKWISYHNGVANARKLFLIHGPSQPFTNPRHAAVAQFVAVPPVCVTAAAFRTGIPAIVNHTFDSDVLAARSRISRPAPVAPQA